MFSQNNVDQIFAVPSKQIGLYPQVEVAVGSRGHGKVHEIEQLKCQVYYSIVSLTVGRPLPAVADV